MAKDGVRLTVQLPLAMSPWTAPRRYVTMVSPSPEKGLAIFATLVATARSFCCGDAVDG